MQQWSERVHEVLMKKQVLMKKISILEATWHFASILKAVLSLLPLPSHSCAGTTTARLGVTRKEAQKDKTIQHTSV